MPRLLSTLVLTFVTVLLYSGCRVHHQSPKMSQTNSVRSMPQFKDLGQLNRWIEESYRTGTRVRIPIEAHPKGPLVSIKTLLTTELQDSISIEIDDGGLGISYADRIRQHCPASKTCPLWLEGVWGQLIGPELRNLDNVPIFAVLLVEPMN